MSDFSYSVDNRNNILHVKMTGRIMEKEQTSEMEQDISDQLTPELNKVILDLNELEYINSNGLNSFIRILTKCRNFGGEAIVINVPEKIKKLLLISKLNTVFTIKESEEEAIEILN